MWRNVHWGCILRNAKSSHTRMVQSVNHRVLFLQSRMWCLLRGPSHDKQRVLLSHVEASCLRSLLITAMDCQAHDASLQTECGRSQFASVQIIPVAASVEQKLSLVFLHPLLCYGTRWMAAVGSAKGPAVLQSPAARLRRYGVC
jgi:hypothetical protein